MTFLAILTDIFEILEDMFSTVFAKQSDAGCEYLHLKKKILQKAATTC